MRAATTAAILLVLAGCGRGGGSGGQGTPGDAGTGPEVGVPLDAGPEAAPPCVTNPTTYLEIINACTDAQAVDKTDDLSKMNQPDGALGPLP